MWDKVVSLFGGSVLGGVAKVIEQFNLAPGEKAQLQAALAETEAKLEIAVVAAASETITSEANSPDGWVRRARPTFLWAMYAVLGFNYIVVPAVQLVSGAQLSPMPIPDELYYLFGAGYLGYVGARSWDKSKSSLLGG